MTERVRTFTCTEVLGWVYTGDLIYQGGQLIGPPDDVRQGWADAAERGIATVRDQARRAGVELSSRVAVTIGYDSATHRQELTVKVSGVPTPRARLRALLDRVAAR